MAKEFITKNDILSAFTQVNSSDGCVILLEVYVFNGEV